MCVTLLIFINMVCYPKNINMSNFSNFVVTPFLTTIVLRPIYHIATET
jgi:hypothetical protein